MDHRAVRAAISPPPADDRIVKVERRQDPYAQREAIMISVFMNVFNVLSSRSLVDDKYRAGAVFSRQVRECRLGQGINRK
jgi:hypothetical protein